MQIWILDPDISFAYRIKDKVKSSPIFQKLPTELDIEVFHSRVAFMEYFQKKKRELVKKPFLIILDPHREESGGFPLYQDIIGKEAAAADRFLFCTSMNHSQFEDYFQAKSLPVPAYVHKLKFDSEWDGAVATLVAGEASRQPETVPWQGVVARKARQWLQGLKKDMEELEGQFYEGVKEAQAVIPILERIGSYSQNLNIPSITSLAQGILGSLANKESPASMKMKRDIRQLMALGKKTLDQYKHLV